MHWHTASRTWNSSNKAGKFYINKKGLTSNSAFSFCNIPSSSAIRRLVPRVFMPLWRDPEPYFFFSIWHRVLSTSENRSSARSTTCHNTELNHYMEWYNSNVIFKDRNLWSQYLICFFSYPVLIFIVEVQLGRWKVDRMNINWCISKASNHFPKPAHVKGEKERERDGNL